MKQDDYLQIIRILLIDYNLDDNVLEYAFDFAIEQDLLDVVELLHNRIYNTTYDYFIKACKYGYLDIVKFLDKKDIYDDYNIPLTVAIDNNHWNIIKYLLKHLEPKIHKKLFENIVIANDIKKFKYLLSDKHNIFYLLSYAIKYKNNTMIYRIINKIYNNNFEKMFTDIKHYMCNGSYDEEHYIVIKFCSKYLIYFLDDILNYKDTPYKIKLFKYLLKKNIFHKSVYLEYKLYKKYKVYIMPKLNLNIKYYEYNINSFIYLYI